MKLKHKLQQLRKSKSALLAANYYNYETLSGTIQAAKQMQCSIILQLTKSSIEYMGLKTAVALGRSMLQAYNIEGWIHLDHAESIDLIEKCLDAGFDSVMIDASEKPFAENISTTQQVVKLAESYDANVEAELGYVPKLGQQTDDIAFTQPADARQFVLETGINALAVAIGSQHGFYKGKPDIKLDLLSQIALETDVPLVLHGGSGIDDDILREAIQRGICKVNIATEIKNIFMKSLQTILASNEEIDLRKVFPPAIESVKHMIVSKLKVIY